MNRSPVPKIDLCVDPFDQLLLTTNRIQALQEQCLQQNFRWHAGPADFV